MKTPPSFKTLPRRLEALLSRLHRSRQKVLKGIAPEALHDFRVTLRRLRTCLRLLEGCFPRGALEPVLLNLKRITADTNNFRDQEVLCERLKSLPAPSKASGEFQKWLQSQEDLRADREREVRKRLASRDFPGWPLRLRKKLFSGKTFRQAGLRMGEAFQREKQKLNEDLRKTRSFKADHPLLHQLRVQAKRVRYSLEEFAFLLPRQAGMTAALCKKAQDSLGEWRDLDRAREILRRAGNGHFPETRPWLKELKKQRTLEWKKAKKAVRTLQEALA